ncbi:hypothetical protein [Agaribacterium haliotis]|uniref:hypothetical protein n=1 Tax=Agaribacterium haliotis TaxID=2013869 RepID=UPI0019562EC0|nr:hypothetical protein [Agaribacterium haliotis]
MKLSKDAQQELGSLLVNQSDLLVVLSFLPGGALDEYPSLQKELHLSHPKIKAYRSALKNGDFTQDEYVDRILARLDIFAYEIAKSLKLDFLVERVAQLVGDELEAIDELSIADIGIESLQRILSGISSELPKRVAPKGDHPFLAERGRIDHRFWRKADAAYDAYNDGYSKQAALDAWCQLNLGTRCPQSFIRWLKVWGDPRELIEWVDYKTA